MKGAGRSLGERKKKANASLGAEQKKPGKDS